MASLAMSEDMAVGSKAESIGMRGRARPGFFFKGRGREPQVDVGNRLYRHRADGMVETATVLSVTTDCMGIPHVRYSLEVQKLRGSTKFSDGPRSLAMEAFKSIYRTEC